MQKERVPDKPANYEVPSLTMVTGGARSGKSTHAADLARSWAGDSVIYIATAPASCDSEFAARIRHHQEHRPHAWTTIEEPLDLTSPLRRFGAEPVVILIDCLTLFVTNLMFDGLSDEMPELPTARALLPEEVRIMEGRTDRAVAQVETVVHEAKSANAPVVVVTNEVGLGLVPDTPLSRYFRDTLGIANQRVAAGADRVDTMVSGIPITIKPSPCSMLTGSHAGERNE